MTPDLSTLNDNQRIAVEWKEGPLLVLAGPGSGKTRVLTYRVAQFIKDSPDKHFKILGLTFTNAAAAEMRQRIASLVSGADERALLTTFHSFTASLLRQHGHHIGLQPDFTILVQESDRLSLLDEAIKAGYPEAGSSSEQLLPLISRLIENDIAPSKALQALKKTSLGDSANIAKVYTAYRELLISRNSLDFPTLIAEGLALLRDQPGVRKQVQRVYPYICVDEFQDTNLIQYQILRKIVHPETRNLFVVADDDQMIYQWNGASPERLKELQSDFNMDLIQLPENYRCPAEVVECANKLIRYNSQRFEEKHQLKPQKNSPSTSVITLKHFQDFPDEAAWVAANIAERPKANRNRCVVLARTRKLLDQVISAFESQGLTGYLAVKKNEFESTPLQWLHSVLRLANAHNSRDHLRKVCKSFYSLEGIDLNVKDVIARSAAEEGDFLLGWIKSALDQPKLSSDVRTLIKKPVTDLAERLDFWSFEKATFEWLDGLPDILSCPKDIFDEYDEEKKTWCSLVREICNQHGRDNVSLHLLLQELDLRSKSPMPPKDGIPCFTIHASKGLEFDHVYLVGLVEDQLPSWAAVKKGDNSREMQEERRNCFVAITRTQETLTLSYSNRVHGWPKWPSRFLKEMELIE